MSNLNKASDAISKRKTSIAVSTEKSQRNVTKELETKSPKFLDDSTKNTKGSSVPSQRTIKITTSSSARRPERKKKEPLNTNLPRPTVNSVQQAKPGITVPHKPQKLALRSEPKFNDSRVIPTSSTSLSHEKIQSRLRKKSPWYDSITSPITGAGVKIPDPIGTDTGTYQHIQNVTINVNEFGIAGIRVISPYINDFAGGDTDGANYQISMAGAGDASTVAWGGSGPIQGSSRSFAVIPALMKANARVHRVVSACVIGQPEISTLADAGEMCAFVTPLECNSNPDGVHSTIPYTQYQAQYDSTMLPVNAHKPLMARWYPIEGEYFEFDGLKKAAGEGQQVSYRDFVDPDDPDTGGVIPWEFGIVCKGMTPSTGVVRFQIIVNYEFIPLQSTAMVAVSPSTIDPMEEQLVNHWISTDPVTSVISQKEASKAPTPSQVKEEPSGFGMLFNVIEEMMPALVQGVPKLLAML